MHIQLLVHTYRSLLLSVCVTFAIVSEILYFLFIFIVYYVISQLSACTSDTCILKDQSVEKRRHSKWSLSWRCRCAQKRNAANKLLAVIAWLVIMNTFIHHEGSTYIHTYNTARLKKQKRKKKIENQHILFASNSNTVKTINHSIFNKTHTTSTNSHIKFTT